MIEIFGYLSMVVVLISMTMRDILTLRIVNSIACAMFIVYGYYLNLYPVMIMNTLVIVINMYKIYKK